MVLLPGCSCCSATPGSDCGCTDFEQYTALKNKVINVTFYGYQFLGRIGINASCGYCTYANFFNETSSAEVSAWLSHFNGITVTLAFDSFTNSSLIWKGSSSVMSSPSGGTVQYFYQALANCFNFSLFEDTTMGCQQNTGWGILTAANATKSPIAFAPSTLFPSFGPPNTTCGSISIPGTLDGISGSQVFCARAESSGCLGANGCAEFYRWRFQGRFQATIETNELP